MFVQPEAVAKMLDIKPGMKVADFGAGPGFYTIPIAKKVGASGKIYAFDIRKDILDLIKAKSRELRLLNIETLCADLEKKDGSHLKNESVDVVMISNILFQVENKKNIAEEAYRILKINGRVILIEWDEEEKNFGPPLSHRVNRQEAENFFLKAGFIFEKEMPVGENHYGLILIKAK